MYLPFINPVWSGLTGQQHLAIILKSRLSSVIGRQLFSEERSESSFGIRVITPRRWDIDISPALYEALKLSARSWPSISKKQL